MQNNLKFISFPFQRVMILFQLPELSHKRSTEFIIAIRVIPAFVNTFTNAFVQSYAFHLVICLFTFRVSSRVQNACPKLHAFFRGACAHELGANVLVASANDLPCFVRHRLLIFQSLYASSVRVFTPKFGFNA